MPILGMRRRYDNARQGSAAAKSSGIAGCLLLRGTPDVEKLCIGSGGERTIELMTRSVKRRANIFLGISQFAQGDFECVSLFQIAELGQDR